MNERRSDYNSESSKNGDSDWVLLDIGCGANKIQPYNERLCARGARIIGIDIDGPPKTQADIVHDLKLFPWPLSDNSVNQIIMNGVMEYLPDVKRTMEEIFRILRPNGILIIDSPYAVSHHTWTDPTHIRGFMSKSFDYFCCDSDYYGGYIRTEARFRLKSVDFEKHGKRKFFFHRALVSFFNKYKRLYELNFLYIFPIRWITFELKCDKEG